MSNALDKYPQDIRVMIVAYRRALRSVMTEDSKAERLSQSLRDRGIDPAQAVQDADSAVQEE